MGGGLPNVAIVPPVRVITPNGPTFCLVSVFWTALTKRPVPPRIRVPLVASPIVSRGLNWPDSWCGAMRRLFWWWCGGDGGVPPMIRTGGEGIGGIAAIPWLGGSSCGGPAATSIPPIRRCADSAGISSYRSFVRSFVHRDIAVQIHS